MKDDRINVLEERVLKLKLSIEKLEVDEKESEENILMLENVVKSKNMEIDDLKHLAKTKENMIDDDECQPSTSKCGKCQYESVDENDLLMHIKSNHEFKCDVCELIFQSDSK